MRGLSVFMPFCNCVLCIVYCERMKDLSLLCSHHFGDSSTEDTDEDDDDEKNYESEMHEPCSHF